jgi:hypothetical protein
MKRYILLTTLVFVQVFCLEKAVAQESKADLIDLSGQWRFQPDPRDIGMKERWFDQTLQDQLILPGSMTTNGKGENIDLLTPWTGSIIDSSLFLKPEYAKYRQPGQVKMPFWLQPVKYYKGAAWYQKTVDVPKTWKDRCLELFIERSHWETTVWVDGKPMGMRNSLGTPHVFNLSKVLGPGRHVLTIRIDNRVKDFDVGQNSHSISDHTQSNWNGMVGKLAIEARPELNLGDIQLYPDIKNRQVRIRVKVNNLRGSRVSALIEMAAISENPGREKLAPLRKEIIVQGPQAEYEMVYQMGEHPLLWDEFNPNLYTMKVRLAEGKTSDVKELRFGMREFGVSGTQLTINGRPIFLRGTLECAIFPKTGYPPTDLASWMRIFKICKSYGLNHMRFHSWTPPAAAFEAADRSGFYLQVECSSWAAQGATIGDGKPLDQYIYAESERVTNVYGNSPSFCMMAYGNEPSGKNHKQYLIEFVKYWKKKDARRIYTTGAGWPAAAENDYNNVPAPRIQLWGAGLKSIINSQPPRTNYDWAEIISKWEIPTVSHEIGQWCAYPNFKEIPKYDGVLKPKNFEIFHDKLEENGMINLADSFLLASGKLQTLCYKADIEAALRTPGFGGFQLLDLHDFPGQGTALVGVLDPFWDDKGYVNSEEYSRFCNATVPLVRLPKIIYLNNEELNAPVEIAHFGSAKLTNVVPAWSIKDARGQILFEGRLDRTDVPVGNTKLGEIRQDLSKVTQAERLILTVSVNDTQNSWDLFVYPVKKPMAGNGILVTQQLDKRALATLNNGGRVLLSVKKGSVRSEKGGDVKVGFSSIFWNTAWTRGQAPTTLGILCNPAHPALRDFPTEYHSNWQWWDAMTHSNAIRLDALSADLQPIVRVIDDWVTAQPLGLIFECKTGKGKLLVSGIDLLTGAGSRPEAEQLLYSLKNYMSGEKFDPKTQVEIKDIMNLFTY